MNLIKHLAQKSSDLYGIKPVTIAFLGDSVTQGCFETFRVSENGLDTVYDYEAVYHTKLKKIFNTLYPAAPINIINAGISGGSAVNGFSRLERDVLAYSPDLVVVCFGLNDVHNGLERIEEYENALQSIFRSLKTKNIEIIFMTPNMMNTNVSPHITDDFIKGIAKQFAEMQNNGVMDAYMNAAKKICNSENIPLCDCYKKWRQLAQAGVNVTELLSNHLNHPTREMHRLFAESLLDKLLSDQY